MRIRLLVIACLALLTATAAVAVPGALGSDPAPVERATGTAPAGQAAASTTEVTPPPPTTTTSTGEVIPPERTVLIVGDSLTEGAAPWLPAALQGVHWGATAIDYVHGRKTLAGLRAIAARHNDLPPTVLISLGTNDMAATPAQIDLWVRLARALAGSRRRLIWVNLHLADRPDHPDFANYHALNVALAQAAAKYHVELADWDGWSVAHHITNAGDGVHYRVDGYQQRAAFYAQVLAAGG